MWVVIWEIPVGGNPQGVDSDPGDPVGGNPQGVGSDLGDPVGGDSVHHKDALSALPNGMLKVLFFYFASYYIGLK